MKVTPEIVTFIRDMREREAPKNRQGEDKPAENSAGYKGLKKFLDEYCDKRGTRIISVSTIGKIIKRYDLTFNPSRLNYHNPESGWAKRKVNYRSKVRHSPRYKEPGYIEIIC